MTNPLSVKTKVHVPRSPSALVSQTEREKVFLEVHIQNLTQDALWFQRIAFECAEGWNVLDTNTPENTKSDDLMFKGAMALMQPQDMRQYIYILSPISVPDFPVTLPPGSVVSLGRLDICWRSSYGEPGRLLTSVCEADYIFVHDSNSYADADTSDPATFCGYGPRGSCGGSGEESNFSASVTYAEECICRTRTSSTKIATTAGAISNAPSSYSATITRDCAASTQAGFAFPCTNSYATSHISTRCHSTATTATTTNKCTSRSHRL